MKTSSRWHISSDEMLLTCFALLVALGMALAFPQLAPYCAGGGVCLLALVGIAGSLN